MKMRALLSLIYRVKCQIYVIDIISSFLYYCKIYIKYEVSLKLVSEDIRAGEWSCPQSPQYTRMQWSVVMLSSILQCC